MKIKFKLSLIMIAIVAVIVTVVAVLLVREASDISMSLNNDKLELLAEEQAIYWKGREDSHIRALRTLANIMGDYHEIAPEDRRDRFDSMLLSTLEAESSWGLIFTTWKPNALDHMDSQYIGRLGSNEYGQYVMCYTKETGELTARPATPSQVEASMAHISGPDKWKDRVQDPIPRTINGKDTYVIIMTTPITSTDTNEIVGEVGCMLLVDVIQPVLADVLSQHSEIAASVIYSGNGFILAHSIPDRVYKNLLDVDTIFGDEIHAAARAVREGRSFKTVQYSDDFKSNLDIVLEPIQIGTSDMSWSIMVTIDEATMMADVNRVTRFTVILAVCAILISVVIIYFVLGQITKPIVTVAETLKDISEGEGDLTRTVDVQSADEIGDLAKYFNKTLEKIKNLIIVIKQKAVVLADVGTELSSNMTETAAAIRQITATTQTIKGRVINQSASVTQTNATMEQITNNIDKLNYHVESQAASVSQSSSAVEEMLANIKSVTNILVKNTESVKNLSGASEVGRGGLQDVAADIQEIARESEGLLEINSVMQNIASQTNLLSMNAAIEAAHAGEAGKGFAVVADEIRKLAESSSEQSKTIGIVLKKIKGSIDKITDSAGNVLNKFEAIDSGVKTVSDQEETIRNAMEEQNQGSKQILDAISQLNQITQQVKGGTMEMLEGSKEVISESKNLETVTQEITGGMNEMASGADQINAAVNRVNDITILNRDNIDMLVKEVSKFKVE